MSYNIKKFQSEGLVDIPYPSDLRKLVVSAAESWKLFCDLPRDLKDKFIYIDNTGFELKEEAGSTKDLKENFHVTVDQISRLSAIAKGTLDTKTIKFIRDAEDLIRLAEPFITDFADKIEKEFSIPGFKDDCLVRKNHWTVRYLHYFSDRKEGEQIASPHADKGGFTLHLFESAPGLQYLDYEKNWQEMPVSEGSTVIIPGMELQLKSKNKLRALCHRVIATKDTASTGRYSMVLFVNFANTPKYNKEGKGRMQDFAPGFNYTMPFEEFSTLFI